MYVIGQTPCLSLCMSFGRSPAYLQECDWIPPAYLYVCVWIDPLLISKYVIGYPAYLFLCDWIGPMLISKCVIG